MTIVLSGKKGTIRWAIEANGGPLGMLDRATANNVVRGALMTAARAWIGAFLPKRFTDYVDSPPFPYPRHRDGFYINKARRMGLMQGVFDRFLSGWDPWSTDKPPLKLIEGWKKQNPGKYKFSITGGYSGLFADLRRWGKQLAANMVLQMLDKLLPLVESGLLRKTAIGGARASATATSTRQTITIALPMPVYPRQLETKKFGHNPVVRQVLVTLPTWEVAFISKIVQRSIASTLSRKHGLRTAFGQTVQGPSAARNSQAVIARRQSQTGSTARRGI